MAKVAVILPAAGKSTRFMKQSRKKPFVELKGRAVWLRTADLYVNREDVVQTLLVVSPDDMDWFKDKFRPNLAFMSVEVVAGGAERADSVQNALAEVSDEADFVAVHDAARPLMVKPWIDAIFQSAEEHGASIPGIPITETVKRGTSAGDSAVIDETIDRTGLWRAQTPQVFRKDLLREAYASRGDAPATDEASLVEALGHKVSLVEGSPMNLKITTADDFRMAEALIEKLPREDRRPLHPFAD